MTVSLLLRLLSSSRRRRKIMSLDSLLLLVLSVSLAKSINPNTNPFPDDILTPYPEGKHGSTRTSRDISTCMHTRWENRTVETFEISTEPPGAKGVKYQIHKFADIVHRTPLRKRYAVGSVTLLDNPYYTLSVLEPVHKGSCEGSFSFVAKATVQETASKRKYGCRLAANAGFFTVANGNCLGNIVSDGHLVQSSGGVQNVNFGIRDDGVIVVGYIAEEELYDKSNPFRQLVSGVVWLVRNGTNYVNESKKLECSENEGTGKMETFVNVLSARSAIGHDREGRVVLVRVEGQTHMRGMRYESLLFSASLYEFADILINKGVVNAINLDGGGSNTLVEDGLLLNYPSDHCRYDGKYRCPRPVSTILCVHDVECLEPDCSNHGSCDLGTCSCDPPWEGEVCHVLNCTSTNCSEHGICEEGSCHCDSGWWGDFCDQPCPPNRYGPGCKSYCYCYGKGRCHPVYGNCTCSPGYHGTHCWNKCSKGYYGDNCVHRCIYPECSGHGECSITNGTCICHEGWSGVSCNDSVLLLDTPSLIASITSSLSLPSPSPSPSLTTSNTVIIQSPTGCTGITNSTLSPPLLPHNQFTAILVLTAVGTLLAHLLLCTLHKCCCNGGGVAFNKAKIKRQLMERREWQQIMLENSHWNSSSNED